MKCKECKCNDVSYIEKIIKYRCLKCGEFFNVEEECINHIDRHERINKANRMLDNRHTLQEIQNECNIWDSVPEHLQDVNKDNCFVILCWQCCDKPAYRIIHIEMDGRVRVQGCGNGYYGESLKLDSRKLRDVHNKEELFVSDICYR